MGIIHKLKPEVLSFILENKQNNPALSCRHLTSLILEQLQIKVSKSSINAVFKGNNLSMPIGRRRKQKKKKFNMPVLPVIEGVKVTRLGDLPQEIVQDQKKEIIAEEKAAQELAKIKALEEARLRDLERLAQEAAENKRKEEEVRKLEEEKAAQELAKIKALEEAKLRDLEKAAQELAKIKALEEARLRDLERLAQEAAENKRKVEEEAVQEAFLQTFRSIRHFDQNRPFAPWFMRSVVNAAIKATQKAVRYIPVSKAYDDADWEELLSAGVSVEQQVETSEFQRRLWEAMQNLSPRQCAAVVQRYFLDMNEKEIAAELKAAPGTVKWLLHAARKNLRSRLSERNKK